MPLLSGFTMMRNAVKLQYPALEAVRSSLPIVSEFVVALGEGDPDDDTEARLRALGDERIRIIRRRWDPQLYRSGTIFAQETTFALEQCRAEWCLYLQADEVLHEDDLGTIVDYCERYRHDPRVEGFLFDYYHFWGDYQHHLDTHGVCRREIRIVRSGIGAFSYLDAVSFRKRTNDKLRVVRIPARIYHYGYVRPPRLMAVKKQVQDAIHHGRELTIAEASRGDGAFEYGPLGELPSFQGTHPQVMESRIAQLGWSDQLNYARRTATDPVHHKHERLRCRMLSWFERRFTDNREIGWNNYRLVRARPQTLLAPGAGPGRATARPTRPGQDRLRPSM